MESTELTTFAVAQDAPQDTAIWTIVAAAVALVLIAVAVVVTVRRLRRRRRRELRSAASEGIEVLLVTPIPAATTRTGRVDSEPADRVRDSTERVRTALVELERVSRFETSAAALALRHHTAELGRDLEARLRGEGDPYLLDVRITELRERVRGARDRLDAAVGG